MTADAEAGATEPPGAAGRARISPVDDAQAASLRPAMLRLWVEVTEAGGSVGFRPPVTEEEVAPAVDELLAEVADGRSLLLVATAGDELVGLVAASRGAPPRLGHRVTLRRLQVHPSQQGAGLGARLVDAAHTEAQRAWGSELALVTVRDGQGLERFYERLGYEECGRIPGGLAFEDGDRLDEVLFVRRLA